jgi:hypothetical protein
MRINLHWDRILFPVLTGKCPVPQGRQDGFEENWIARNGVLTQPTKMARRGTTGPDFVVQ